VVNEIALLCNGYGMVDRGAERYSEELYNLLKDDFDITLFGMKTTDISWGMYTKPRHAFKIPWRNGRAYMEAYLFGKKWYEMYKDHRYDLIINNAGLGGSYWCRKYRKKTGVPFITLERGGGKEEIFNYLCKPDCMVFLTKESERKNKKWYLPSVNTTAIPIGIHLNEFESKSKSDLIKGLQHPIVLSTSALVGFKRIDLIMNAVFALGHGSMVQTSDGDLREEWCDNGHGLLGDQFKYVGKIDRDELIKLYHSCDVFVNASRAEAFGIVYLEAMASGLPIVTQDDARRREIIGEAGEFVDCTDEQAFATAIETATAKKDIALEQAKKYDWNKIKEKHIEVIESVIK